MIVTILILIDGFLQLDLNFKVVGFKESHNPYFNRWFSAIEFSFLKCNDFNVTILILIDGFLQLDLIGDNHNIIRLSQSLF